MLEYEGFINSLIEVKMVKKILLVDLPQQRYK